MPYTVVGDLRMYYDEHGSAGAPPLVLLHGFSGTTDQWRHQVERFSAQYRLIVPELRGHGRTDNPAGLPAMNHRRFARDIIAFCGALGITQAAFCGESTGAMLLLTLGLEAPSLARALVLAGGTYYYDEKIRAWWRAGAPEAIMHDPAARARHTALGPDHWRLIGEAFLALEMHAHTDDFPEADELTGIRAPVLIIHGDRDPLFPTRIATDLYRLLPDAELCILPDAELCILPRTGHVPPNERPDWFNAIVLDFLARRMAG